MKIAVITFHCSYNYGSVLQAYALQTYLKKQGHEVKIIDYVLSSDFRQYKLIRFDRYIKKPKFLISDIYFLPKTSKRKKNFEAFIHGKLEITDKRYSDNDDLSELNEYFDAFICGSDQIWNTGCTKHIIPPYFLSFASDNKLKIAYAPSIAQVNDTSQDEKNQLEKLVNRLDFISVREKSTIPYISQFTEKKVEAVLDPTLLIDKNDYLKLISGFENLKTKYIFYYTLQNNPEMADYCQQLSEKKKLKILYISKLNIKKFKNSSNIYGCSPEEFLFYIKNAEYIVTNSFHATVFSIVFEKKFCTFGTKKSYIRMLDFLQALGLEKRMYKDENFNIDDKINYTDAYIKKDILSKSSKEFLDKNLTRGVDK